MIKMKKYVLVESIEQAYELNQKKSNRILGGMGWLKMQGKSVDTGIDLSALEMDQIIEGNTYFRVGAMVTLRQLEESEELKNWYGNIMKECVGRIVGVQFRNSATIGGSIFGRFGFSDVLTLFLALGAKVELHKRGIIYLDEFLNMPNDNDVLVNVLLPKNKKAVAYETFRIQATDFPVINVGVSKSTTGKARLAIGARPFRADVKFYCELDDVLEGVKDFDFGSNMRGSKEYREMLAEILTKRCVEKLKEVE